MMDDAELIARLRGWAKDIQEGSEAIWAMDQDLKEAAAGIEALIAERDAARNAALEEAARIAETLGVHPQLNVWGGGPDWFKHGKNIAGAIRALKGKSHE